MDERVIGLDLGLSQDYTAIAVVRRVEFEGTAEEREVWEQRRDYYTEHHLPLPDYLVTQPVYHLVGLERPQLGTTYPMIVEGVKQIVGESDEPTRLVVDSTGVGRPVVDMLKQAGLKPLPVLITSGSQVTTEKGTLRVPKRDIIVASLALLQAGRLKLAADLPLVQTLADELLNYRLTITTAGNETFEPWREGQHDDLLFALCLAVWLSDKKPHRPFPNFTVGAPAFTGGR